MTLPMKVALAFFGITRSLKYTIKSIKFNIIDELEKNGIEHDVFLHSYIVSSYSNKRTGEKCDNMDNEEYKILNPKYVQIDNQDLIKEKLNLAEYRTHKDPWKTNYNSVDNFILGKFSLQCVTQLIKNTNEYYDYIIFLRPDVCYLNKITTFLETNNNGPTIIIPSFHLFGKYKFNDRFCIATMNTYEIYGNVFEKLLDLSKKQELHSETIMGQIISNAAITIKRVPFVFRRIRCNGKIEPKDKRL